MKMKSIKIIIVVGYLSSSAMLATAKATVTPEDIATISEAWVCKWCPKPSASQTKGYVSGKLGSVSNDSFKQGDYNGLNEKGGYVSADADIRIGSQNSDQVKIRAVDLALDTQQVEVDSRNQGQYRGKISYQQVPKYGTDTARTPYLGDGNKTLPSGWVAGASTIDFSTLVNDLHDEDIETRRDTLSFDARYYQSEKISYDLTYSHDSKEGNHAFGVALGNVFALAKAVILPVPIKYVTDHIKASANYLNGPMTASLSVERSNFNNLNESVRWQNAFSEPAGVSEGQIALAPDNSARSLSLSGSYKFTDTTSAMGYLSFGDMTQDSQFLPSTINSALTTSGLSRASLDGKINTLSANLNVNSLLADKLMIYARYAYQEQDNDTERASYEYVTADTAVNSIIRANFPYSFRKQKIDVKARYPLVSKSVVTSGVNIQHHDRTYQEITRSREVAIWAKFKKIIFDNTEASLGLDLSDRQIDTYIAVDEILPVENPLLRKYNLADRDRHKLNLSVAHFFSIRLNVNFEFELLKNDYNNSELGLLDANENNTSLDVDYIFNPAMSLNGFLSTTRIASSQNGINWNADNKERFNVVGITVKYDFIPDRFNLKLGYVNAKSRGQTSLFSATVSDFPEVVIDRQTLDISGDYKLKKKLSISMLFRYEKYDESDWMIDSVVPNTIANVLTLGEQNPSYDIGVVAIGLKYQF